MSTLTREQMLDVLNKGGAEVIFTKADGSERTMYATRNEAIIDMITQPDDDDTPKRYIRPNDEVIRVFDIEAEDWRSFRVDSVITFNRR